MGMAKSLTADALSAEQRAMLFLISTNFSFGQRMTRVLLTIWSSESASDDEERSTDAVEESWDEDDGCDEVVEED